VTYARPGLLLVGQTFALVHTDDCAIGAILAIPTEHITTATTTPTAAAGAKHKHHKCNGHTESATTGATTADDAAAATANSAAGAAASTYSNVCCGRCDAPLGVSMATAKPADTSVDTSPQQPVASTSSTATALATGEYTLYRTYESIIQHLP
jgi:HECT-like Ubiquitin-conjugating enzyme (E2)-binding